MLFEIFSLTFKKSFCLGSPLKIHINQPNQMFYFLNPNSEGLLNVSLVGEIQGLQPFCIISKRSILGTKGVDLI